MAFFLGIDGGGSKTVCEVGDETTLLGTGTAEGSNIVRVGERQAGESIANSVRRACTAARVNPKHVERTCVGVAGAARPEIAEAVRRVLAEIVSGEIEVVGDMLIASEAAQGSGPGVIVISGTGSIAYGRNSAGRTARAGGWGFAISDEGSGHWIGRMAVAATMRAYDEGQTTMLLETITKSWGVSTREQIILAANASPPANFAALLPAVLKAADAGDPAAHDILAQAGAELSTLAKIVISRIFENTKGVPVAMSGGVFGNSELVRRVFYNSLRLKYPEVVINTNIIEPVTGALELARKGTQRPRA